jgi:hypothetical protein
MQSLSAYGQAFDSVLVARAVEVVLGFVVLACCCAAVDGCARWSAAHVQRRYARAGIRELERYLSESASRRPGETGRP